MLYPVSSSPTQLYNYLHIIFLSIFLSPGFLKDDFMRYLTAKAVRVGDLEFIKQKSKFLKAHTSSGYKKAIEELLGNPEFSQQLLAVKAADEVTVCVCVRVRVCACACVCVCVIVYMLIFSLTLNPLTPFPLPPTLLPTLPVALSLSPTLSPTLPLTLSLPHSLSYSNPLSLPHSLSYSNRMGDCDGTPGQGPTSVLRLPLS